MHNSDWKMCAFRYFMYDMYLWRAEKSPSISYAENVPIKMFPNTKIDMQINSVDFILWQILCAKYSNRCTGCRCFYVMQTVRSEQNKTHYALDAQFNLHGNFSMAMNRSFGTIIRATVRLRRFGAFFSTISWNIHLFILWSALAQVNEANTNESYRNKISIKMCVCVFGLASNSTVLLWC